MRAVRRRRAGADCGRLMLSATWSVTRMDPFGMTEFTREQIHQIFLKRYAKHLDSSEQEPIHTVEPSILSFLRGPGGEISDWHFEAFAEIDDLIKANPSEDKKVSIQQVRDKYEKLGHAHCYDSFEGMYYEFKREKELEYRRRRFAEHLFDGNAEEAVEHLYKLSLITNIDSLFSTTE